jgi:hypothetical protein
LHDCILTQDLDREGTFVSFALVQIADSIQRDIGQTGHRLAPHSVDVKPRICAASVHVPTCPHPRAELGMRDTISWAVQVDLYDSSEYTEPLAAQAACSLAWAIELNRRHDTRGELQ